MSLARGVGSGLLVLVLQLAWAATTVQAHRSEPFSRSLLVGSRARPTSDVLAFGQEALTAIGLDLNAVAQKARVAPLALAKALREGGDLAYDKKSKSVLYVCGGLMTDPTLRRRALLASSAVPGEPDPTDLQLTFKLHSRPGANKLIYLDFTGHTTSGTAWNAAYTNGADFTTPPFSADADPNFSAEELRFIISVWRQVAEDYASFEVDVTTEEPLNADGTPKSLEGIGARVIIGGSSYDWLKAGAGGIAYIGVFGQPYYEGAFVFPAQLSQGTFPKYESEAISHEVGHNLGLLHDGVTGGTEYYFGQGDWAPIMGVGYYKNITQFSKGEYANANQQQDDLATIAQNFPVRDDDHGNSAASATVLTGTQLAGNPRVSTATASFNIERSGDADWFVFEAGTGPATFSVSLVPGIGRANADARLEVRKTTLAIVQVLQSWDPQGALLSGPNTMTLPADGNYFVVVTGVGDGSATSTGYTSYGSLGEVKLSVQYPTPPRLLPVTAAIKVLSSTINPNLLSVLLRTYSVTATVGLVDSNGAPLKSSATISYTWSSPNNRFSPKSYVTTTSPSTGQATLTASPTARSPTTARLTITELVVQGYTWDVARSDTPKDFKW